MSGSGPPPPSNDELNDLIQGLGNELDTQTPEYIQDIIKYTTGDTDAQDAAKAKLGIILGMYENIADGVYDDGTGTGAKNIPPDAYRVMSQIIKARERALKKISEERKKLGAEARNTLMKAGDPIDENILEKDMLIDEYYTDVLLSDPIFNNFNGVTVLDGKSATLTLDQVVEILMAGTSTQVVNSLLSYFFTKGGIFRKEAYEMQTLSCLYTGAGGPGELTFDVSPINIPNRFTLGDGGITVTAADIANTGTYALPVLFSRDYQNLVKVASIITKDSSIAAGNKIGYLNRCQSFPSILRIEMLRLKPGFQQTSKVHRKPGSDTYLFAFKYSKGSVFEVPFDPRYYKLPQGMALYARADGIVVHFDSTNSKLVAEFPLGTYAISPDGVTEPFLRSDIQQQVYADLVTTTSSLNLNVTADQVVADTQTQQRLIMLAYIRNYQYDEDRVATTYEGRTGGGHHRRRSKSGGGGGSKKKLKKMTRKRKNRSKSKSKN